MNSKRVIQAFTVKCDPKHGESAPIFHPTCARPDVPEGYVLPSKLDDHIDNTVDLLFDIVKKYGPKSLFGTRKDNEYQWISYEDVKSLVIGLSSGVVDLIPPGSNVGIYSNNRPEWMYSMFAVHARGACLVPLYDTLGADAIYHIVSNANLKVIFASMDRAKTLCSILAKESLSSITDIIILDKDSETEKSLNDLRETVGQRVKIDSLYNIVKKGLDNPIEVTRPNSDDLACIYYTSGTTGIPKGAMISHKNIISTAAGVLQLGQTNPATGLPYWFKPTVNDVHFSYLPLAHVFEFTVQILFMSAGASIGFYSGDITKISDDMSILKPTIFISVPRIISRMKSGILAKLQQKPLLIRYLFERAFNAKMSQLHKDGNFKHWLYDILFSPIRDRLGGRIRIIVSGSAPLSSDLIDFMKVMFSCYVTEGYGQTESCCGCCITQIGDNASDIIGPPYPTNLVKVIDVPEMSYYASGPVPRGELCIKGPNVFKGYWKDDEKTQQTIDQDGWLHTGDVAEIDEVGRIRIIDRVKSIFKLSQGEYIAPEKVESILLSSPLISQVFVYGRSVENALVAIVVPNKDSLISWWKRNGFENASYEQICNDSKVKRLYESEMKQYGPRGSGSLKGFEVPICVHVEPKEFGADNPDMLTQTQKLKRHIATQHYSPIFDGLYAELAAQGM